VVGLPELGQALNFFGTPVAWNDPALYLIAWVVLTAGLVVMASAGYSEVALGLAATVVLSVAIVTRGRGLPFTASSSGGGGGGGANIAAS
jgi:hypothetical protein